MKQTQQTDLFTSTLTRKSWKQLRVEADAEYAFKFCDTLTYDKVLELVKEGLDTQSIISIDHMVRNEMQYEADQDFKDELDSLLKE